MRALVPSGTVPHPPVAHATGIFSASGRRWRLRYSGRGGAMPGIAASLITARQCASKASITLGL